MNEKIFKNTMPRFVLVVAIFLSFCYAKSQNSYTSDFRDGEYSFKILSEEERSVEVWRRSDKPGDNNTIRIPETATFDGKTYTVTGLELNAFYPYESEIEYLYIPKTIEDIGIAVMQCYSIKEFIVDPENPYLCGEGPILYNKDKTVLVAYPAVSGDVIIPDGVETIQNFVFYFNDKITSITIPASTKQLGKISFGCMNVSSITCLAPEPPALLYRWFIFNEDYDMMQDIPIYVPVESVEKYKESNWSWQKQWIFPIEDSGVESIEDAVQSDIYNVFSIDGRHVITTPDYSTVQSLPAGIYIVNGKKLILPLR